MTIELFNSLGRRREPLRPIEPGHVRVYTCGPTVHDVAHIGNFRTFLFEDLLRRTLKLHGYRVTQVMNLTDVDDKTIRKSRDRGEPLRAYTARYKRAFFADLDALRVERAEHYPAATEHIGDMVSMIEALRERGHTYEAGGSLYFALSSFPEYGRLSGARLDAAPRRSRIDQDEYAKEDARDFALWKAWSPADGDVYWDTRLGRGRPGWHIECSAMSQALLGDHFDIHTGGVDNCFPHHENEIAQSQAATGAPFVNVWLHSEHLLVNGQKMSKSLGNYTTLRDLIARGWSPVAVRYALLSAHYRTQMNLTDALLHASVQSVERIRELHRRLTADPIEPDAEAPELVREARERFRGALFSDLNLPEALGHLFVLVREVNARLDEGLLTAGEQAALRAWLEEDVDAVLDVLRVEGVEDDRGEQVARLVAARERAREAREWAKADALRAEILSLGYALKDTPEGPVWNLRLG